MADENFISQFMMIVALYRLGYYSNILRRSSIIMISYVLIAVIIAVLRNYLVASDLFIAGAFILVPSYGLVIRGLNNARRNIINLIVELSKPSGSRLFIRKNLISPNYP